MSPRSGPIIRWALVSISALLVVLLLIRRSSIVHVQAQHVPIHMTSDWSNRHVVYSTPSSAPIANQLRADHRYQRQLVIRKGLSPEVAP